jgi:hypothetical protein
MEGDGEEALLAAAANEVANVEEGLRSDSPLLDDVNRPRLLDDVEATRLARRRG